MRLSRIWRILQINENADSDNARQKRDLSSQIPGWLDILQGRFELRFQVGQAFLCDRTYSHAISGHVYYSQWNHSSPSPSLPIMVHACAPVISQVSQLNLGRCLMGFFSPFPVFNGLQSLWNEPTSCISSKIPKSCQACGWWWYVE